MPRAAKPKKPIESPRLAQSFDPVDLQAIYETWRRTTSIGLWTVERLHAARDAQVRGCFRAPAELANKLRCEPRVFSAEENRIAPHRGLPCEITCEEELSGSRAAWLAEAVSMFCSPGSSSLPQGIHSDAFRGLAMHGIEVEQTVWVPRRDGSRLDPFVQPWPHEDLEWQSSGIISQLPDGTWHEEHGLYAITTDGRVKVEHGDGRWIVTQKSVDRPWRFGALVALADLVGELAFGRRDRSANARSHGDDKWIGTLPQGVPVKSAEGQAMLAELLKLYEARRALVIPNGSTVKRDEALGQNYQIFKELIDADSKDVERILLGQDGTMSTSGGDYLKSWLLFGVRNDIVESDLAARGAAISTGLLRPWSLINFGRWDRWVFGWQMPDGDEDARLDSIAKRRKAFWEDVALSRTNGALVDDNYLRELAKQYKLKAVPKLAPQLPAASEGSLAIVPNRQPLRPVSAG